MLLWMLSLFWDCLTLNPDALFKCIVFNGAYDETA